MSTQIKRCIKGLNTEGQSEELLKTYVKEYMVLQDGFARTKLMMEYYMLYETISENINPYIEEAKETAQFLHGVIEDYFVKQKCDQVACRKMAEKLLAVRQEIIDRMQVLTAYVDCFVVYEYVLNRVQYRFEDMEMLPEDTLFAQQLVNFIFSSEDNAEISDNIRFVIGQLPMRMTRSRYFDLLKDSISVYKGSDVSSLESFLYMFRTNAMLYKDENQKKYFTEFASVLEELSALDYDNLTEDLYHIYADKIRTNASKLNDVSDLYMSLGMLVNEMYTICVTTTYASELHREEQEEEFVIKGINAMFLHQDSDVFNRGEISSVMTDEEKINYLGEHFVAMEGKQEKLFEGLDMAGAALEEISEGHKETIAACGLAEDFVILRNLFLMSSTSIFADLEDQVIGDKVTTAMADEEAAKLIAECKEHFKGKSRMLRRAIMANTLEKMPVFFTSAQEVADYITSSLAQCDDEAEKYAAKQLLMEIM